MMQLVESGTDWLVGRQKSAKHGGKICNRIPAQLMKTNDNMKAEQFSS
jgi:hypothetical protein